MTQQVDAVVQDEIVGDIVKKKVDEFSLDEIKNELEKRSLDASGDDYAILHERLTDHMIEEGLDPATFEFEIEADDDDDEEEEEQQPVKEVVSKGVENGKVEVAAPQPAPKPEAEVKPKESSKEIAGNHIWVSGLSSRCKAAELKKFFTKIAPVGSAKIVANARTSSANCYGYITVESGDDLKKCVDKLHGTRFDGSFIKVEECKLGPADQLRKVEMEHRKRLAQQKEEFKKRKAQRRDRIEAEKKKKAVEKQQQPDKKKETGKGQSDVKAVKAAKETGPAKKTIAKGTAPRPRSKSPTRKGPQQPARPQTQKGRRAERPPRPQRRSPPRRMRGRDRSPSPFRGPAPMMYQGPQNGFPDRFLPMDNPRFIDRRMEEERLEFERRQRSEAEALERERKQLRLEKERLEREKLELIRLERERVKKEMEEITMRKKIAESRRQDDLTRHDDGRKAQHVDMDRRGAREDLRLTMVSSGQAPNMNAYDSRGPPPADNYPRIPIEAKFSGRLGPPAQRDVRRDDRRRDVVQRDDRRGGHVETFDPWTAANADADVKSRGQFGNQQHMDGGVRKRGRSRSPMARTNTYGQQSQAYGVARSNGDIGDQWSTQRTQMNSSSNAYNDVRRPMGRGMEQQSDNGWQVNSRVAFPPVYNEQNGSSSIRGFMGSNHAGNGSNGSNGFGPPQISSSYRRY